MSRHAWFLVTYLIFPSFVFYNLCSTKSFILHSISSVEINHISFRLIFYRLYFTTIHADELYQSHLTMQTTTNCMPLPWNRQLQRITDGFNTCNKNRWQYNLCWPPYISELHIYICMICGLNCNA
jgi:hypothetical protein